MLNLTRKAADQFNVDFGNLESREGDLWRIDVITIQRRKYLLCAHEVTLATALLRAVDYRTLSGVVEVLRDRHPWYLGPVELSVGKGSNRRITGTMTDMKKMLPFMTDRTVEELEAFLNHTPYSCLPTKWTDYEIEAYSRAGGISAGYLGALGTGKSEFELARLKFLDEEPRP